MNASQQRTSSPYAMSFGDSKRRMWPKPSMASKRRPAAKKATKPRTAKRAPRTRRPNLTRTLTRVVRADVLLLKPNVKVANGQFDGSVTQIPFSLSGFKSASQEWLVQQMDCYDEFRFVHLSLRWTSAMSRNSTGMVAMYWDPSTNPLLPTSFEDLSGNYGVVPRQVYNSMTMTVNRDRLNRLPWYQVHETGPSASQGTLVFLVSEGTIPSITGTSALGSLWLHCTLEVRNPSKPGVRPSTTLRAMLQSPLATTPANSQPAISNLQELLTTDPEGPSWQDIPDAMLLKTHQNLVDCRRLCTGIAGPTWPKPKYARVTQTPARETIPESSLEELITRLESLELHLVQRVEQLEYQLAEQQVQQSEEPDTTPDVAASEETKEEGL